MTTPMGEHFVTKKWFIWESSTLLLAGFPYLRLCLPLIRMPSRNARCGQFQFQYSARKQSSCVYQYFFFGANGWQPGVRRAYWNFGDGTGTLTAPLQGTQHQASHPVRTYTVCLKIFRYRPNLNDSVLSAQACKTVGDQHCLQSQLWNHWRSQVIQLLLVYFKALYIMIISGLSAFVGISVMEKIPVSNMPIPIPVLIPYVIVIMPPEFTMYV